jgi:hypothetical protein
MGFTTASNLAAPGWLLGWVTFGEKIVNPYDLFTWILHLPVNMGSIEPTPDGVAYAIFTVGRRLHEEWVRRW